MGGPFTNPGMIAHQAVMFYGSPTVFADGESVSGAPCTVMTCDDFGIALPGQTGLYAPNANVISIPMGKSVNIGDAMAPGISNTSGSGPNAFPLKGLLSLTGQEVAEERDDSSEMENETEEENSEEEKECEIYITDLEGTRINDYKIGKEIILVFETKNRQGEEYEVNFNDHTADFKVVATGEVLQNDTIKHTIQTDKDEIKLEVKEQDEDNSYIDFYLEKDGKKIEEYKIGDIIILVIKTKNKRNTEFTINLNDQTADFEYNGNRLKDDTLNYKINSDLEKIELKVIKQKEE